MAEKWVTIYIGGYRRRCPEGKIPKMLEDIEKMKREYIEKGAPMDMVEEAYTVEIVKDED